MSDPIETRKRADEDVTGGERLADDRPEVAGDESRGARVYDRPDSAKGAGGRGAGGRGTGGGSSIAWVLIAIVIIALLLWLVF